MFCFCEQQRMIWQIVLLKQASFTVRQAAVCEFPEKNSNLCANRVYVFKRGCKFTITENKRVAKQRVVSMKPSAVKQWEFVL